MGLGLAALSLAHAASPPARAKNILFIGIDDLRPELGCYGAKHIHSPNIDALARRAIVFERAYCQQAVCTPSRSSLLTGARPDTTQVWGLFGRFRTALPDVVTLPQFFKEHGYFVQGFGKIFHGGRNDPPSWSVPLGEVGGQEWGFSGTYGDPANNELAQRNAAEAEANGKKKSSGERGTKGPAFESADVSDMAFHDGKLAAMAITALREIKARPALPSVRSQPFFLAVGFIRPHLPFVAPKKYWDLYDPAEIELAPNRQPIHGAPEYAVPAGDELRQYAGIPQAPIPDEFARRLRHGYYAAISYVDAQVGRVLDELDRLGLRESTIVVLWSDHGWKLGEHGAWAKHTNTENDTRVPLIVSVPGGENPGRRSRALVELVDIYPSLAELAALPLPTHLEGHSFVPLLSNPDRPWKRAAFSQYPRVSSDGPVMGYSMRTDRHRLTRWVSRTDPSRVDAIELYDEVADPQENENIAGDSRQRDLLTQLTEQSIAGWRGSGPPLR